MTRKITVGSRESLLAVVQARAVIDCLRAAHPELEIELLTRDMTPEELLAVLESYRQKKRYHRLSSGAFVTLDRDSQAMGNIQDWKTSLSYTSGRSSQRDTQIWRKNR